MSVRSILFDGAESTVAPVDQEPAYFADLNLSQVAESITASREECDLKPFLYTRLTTPEAITYRHEVLRDLEGDELAAHIASFVQKMRQMREHLTRAERTHYQSEQQAWFLNAVRIYCDAVGQLAGDLADASVRSHGLQAFRDYLADFINARSSRRFATTPGGSPRGCPQRGTACTSRATGSRSVAMTGRATTAPRSRRPSRNSSPWSSVPRVGIRGKIGYRVRTRSRPRAEGQC